MKKLRDTRGETLVEVLAAILVASLSVTLLFSCVMASSNLDVQAKSVDEDYYQALSAADGQTEGPTVEGGTAKYPKQAGTVTIKGASEVPVDIEIYGGGGLYSYRRPGS